MNKPWILLPVDQFQAEIPGTSPGTRVSYYFSPFNIPTAVHSRHDHERGQNVIEFKYLDDREPTESAENHPGLIFLLGKNSRRIFEIRIKDGQFHNETEIEAELDNQLHGLATLKARRTDNYNITKRVIRTYHTQLLPST